MIYKFFESSSNIPSGLPAFLRLINYSCSSYPTRASYSGQVDEFRSPMKNELKTWPCLKLKQTWMQILLICILIKQQKHEAINNSDLITHFTKQTFGLNYLLLTLNVTARLLNYPKQKNQFVFEILNFHLMVATSCFGALSTSL